MTNYYVKFDSNGVQEECRYGLDAENPSGWVDTGLSNIDNIQFKLVNGSVVPVTEAEKIAKLKAMNYASQVKVARQQRNDLLALSDWTQLPNSALSAEEKQSWAVYRTALRDLPETVDENGVFSLPTPPDPNFIL